MVKPKTKRSYRQAENSFLISVSQTVISAKEIFAKHYFKNKFIIPKQIIWFLKIKKMNY
jgi:hypothetical protein